MRKSRKRVNVHSAVCKFVPRNEGGLPLVVVGGVGWADGGNVWAGFPQVEFSVQGDDGDVVIIVGDVEVGMHGNEVSRHPQRVRRVVCSVAVVLSQDHGQRAAKTAHTEAQ